MKSHISFLNGVIHALAAESTIQSLLGEVEISETEFAVNRVTFAVNFNVLAEWR
jgi:sulfur carrier protein ThiS